MTAAAPTPIAADAPAMWHLTVTCNAKLLTPNARTDWRAKGDIVKAWRAATYYAAQQAKLPVGLARIRIDAAYRPAVNRGRDRANLVDALKPVVDGLGPPFVQYGRKAAAAPGWGLIPDDSDDHLDGPHVEVGPKVGKGEPHRIELVITDLSALAGHRTWTPERITADGARRISVKRACNGCGRRLGDVLPEEIEAAFAGWQLPDVRGECPTCRAVG